MVVCERGGVLDELLCIYTSRPPYLCEVALTAAAAIVAFNFTLSKLLLNIGFTRAGSVWPTGVRMSPSWQLTSRSLSSAAQVPTTRGTAVVCARGSLHPLPWLPSNPGAASSRGTSSEFTARILGSVLAPGPSPATDGLFWLESPGPSPLSIGVGRVVVKGLRVVVATTETSGRVIAQRSTGAVDIKPGANP